MRRALDTWPYKEDALAKDLCDELKTTDDVLLDMLEKGTEIFSVKYRPPQTGPAALLAGVGGAQAGAAGGWGTLRVGRTRKYALPATQFTGSS